MPVAPNRVEARKPVVSYSQIMSLATLQAYVRLPGHYPITLLELTYQERQCVNPGFCLRAELQDAFLSQVAPAITEYRTRWIKNNSY